MATALAFGAALARECGDVDRARTLADRNVALSYEHGFYFWLALGMCSQGWALYRTGGREPGLGQIRAGLSLLRNIGSRVNFAYFLSYLIECCLEEGLIDEARTALDEALELCTVTFGRNYIPEIERLKAELQAKSGDVVGAQASLDRALASARAHGSKLLERRASETLASLQPALAVSLPSPPRPSTPI